MKELIRSYCIESTGKVKERYFGSFARIRRILIMIQRIGNTME